MQIIIRVIIIIIALLSSMDCGPACRGQDGSRKTYWTLVFLGWVEEDFTHVVAFNHMQEAQRWSDFSKVVQLRRGKLGLCQQRCWALSTRYYLTSPHLGSFLPNLQTQSQSCGSISTQLVSREERPSKGHQKVLLLGKDSHFGKGEGWTKAHLSALLMCNQQGRAGRWWPVKIIFPVKVQRKQSELSHP